MMRRGRAKQAAALTAIGMVGFAASIVAAHNRKFGFRDAAGEIMAYLWDARAHTGAITWRA
jgi:YD repeat-containing protein